MCDLLQVASLCAQLLSCKFLWPLEVWKVLKGPKVPKNGHFWHIRTRILGGLLDLDQGVGIWSSTPPSKLCTMKFWSDWALFEEIWIVFEKVMALRPFWGVPGGHLGAHLGPKESESGDRSLHQSCAESNLRANGLGLRSFCAILRKLWPQEEQEWAVSTSLKY